MASSSNKSLREMKMSSLLSSLMSEYPNESTMEAILQENKALLIEPILNGPPGGDYSIYDQNMTVMERFDRYKQVMQERVDSALNAKVKKVLAFMMNFVVSNFREE
eukprot:CAMPEP_0194281250 /NCGR_PEP_ID=MMETSP0169-20130528/20356_1 /TAXON_ID=218684 /ORGANISM="Corethron pennatum, Strain L29A3" /LENGTH=105 /DNA_ID=CAMNT_0039026257 /DNA_START=344 /DNA_END=661 /DNA_ORIENTATION=+